MGDQLQVKAGSADGASPAGLDLTAVASLPIGIGAIWRGVPSLYYAVAYASGKQGLA